MKVTNLKHESSSVNNIVLNSDGSVGGELGSTLASKLPYSYGTATPSTTDSGFLWYDSNSTPAAPKFWNGSTFVDFPSGLSLVTAETFSAVSSVSLNGCFTSSYENYRIICKMNGSSNSNAVTLRLRASGSDDATSNYGYAHLGLSFNSNARNTNSNGTTSLFLGNSQSADGSNHYSLDIAGPQTADHTTFVGSVLSIASADTAATPATVWHVGCRFQATTVFDGFSLLLSGGTMTGSVRVYGYKD